MRPFAVVLLLLATPATAHADWFAVPFMGVKFGGGTFFDLEFAGGDTKFTFGGAAMEMDSGFLGFEASFAYVPGYFERDESLPIWTSGSFIIDSAGSVVLSLPPQVTAGGLRPYVTIGAGLLHAQAADLLHTFQVRRTVPVGTVGVGAIGLFTNNVGVRFDYRYTRSLTTDDGSLSSVGRRITFSRFTFGLLLRL